MANSLLTSDRRQEIEVLVNGLLVGCDVDFDTRSVLQKILNQENLELKEVNLQDLSGILYKESDDKWSILVNKDDSSTRQIFTIAHELGHYFLHRSDNDRFVDGQFVGATYARAESDRFHKNEVEANEFAGNLLMPEPIIKSILTESGADSVSDSQTLILSQKFGVSLIAIITRLRNLGYVVR